MPGNDVTFVTPTYRRDFERFCFLRESFERCGVELPHVAIVQHEDLPRFRDVPHHKNLTLVSTRDVLSKPIEERRWAARYPRRNPRRWWYARHGAPLHGWGTQQLVKLASARVVHTTGIVAIDSDNFFVKTVRSQDFFATDGRLHLYETDDDIDAEMAAWPADAMRFLGIPPVGKPLHRYTHWPVPMHREVLLELHQHIEQRYQRPWESAFMENSVTEYALYGVFAREVDGLRRVIPVRPPLTLRFWWPHEIALFEETFARRIATTGAKIVGVQSNADCPLARYRPLVEQLWAENAPHLRAGTLTATA